LYTRPLNLNTDFWPSTSQLGSWDPRYREPRFGPHDHITGRKRWQHRL